jgi:Winged helix DNA-binding domain
MDSNRLRAWYAKKQGLDGSLQGATSAAVLQKTGWARSVGGANPYLSLFSRAEINRDSADQAAAKLEIHELPSARGCTYVVPASDYALALTVGRGFGEEAEIQLAIKYLKVTEREIEKLMQSVIAALKDGPKDPRKLKEHLGSAVRNLGKEGKKRGMSTTLPLALGKLQTMGQIRRIPASGRLDQQRYSYALWQPSPLQKSKLSENAAQIELLRKYFQWIGPATLKEFQWFSGWSLKTCKEVASAIKLLSAEPDNELLILEEEADAFRSFRPPSKAFYCLVSSLDNVMHLRRDLSALLDPADQKRDVLQDKKKNLLQDLPYHAILDRGRVIGLWEFEVSTGKIAWSSFAPADKELKSVIGKTEEFVREQLGDARSFSLDTPESRSSRIAALRT